MSSCVQCGRELPSFSIGSLKNVCPACQFEQQQQQAAQPQVQQKPTFIEQARAFPVTSTIVAINVVVYAICVAFGYLTGQGNLFDFSPRLLATLGANFGPYTLNGQWWRIFTCMWMHGGLIHIGSNMYCFWQFGRIAERVFGRNRYLAIYLITGLAASITSVAWHPMIVSIGASGAIFGVAGALFVPFYRKRLRLPPPVMHSMMRSIGLFIVINLIIGASLPFIDVSAHLGGLVSGFLLGSIFVEQAARGEESIALVVAFCTVLLVAGFMFTRRERLPFVQKQLQQLEQQNQTQGHQPK
ncbi:MAG TPA: rhomboid family intramembrane serine protease [Terriglobales bacterium]|nr:rhomboid family intramembrane serine protease [Terriglobales bacterium]